MPTIFSNFFKMWESIDSQLIQSLVGYADQSGLPEYKCQIKCPACPRIIIANHKVYAAGARKRKNKEKTVVSCRKAAWYFSNLQSHLLQNHFGDEIETIIPETQQEANLFDDQNFHDERNGNNIEWESTSCNNGDKGVEEMIVFDPIDSTDYSNSSTIAKKPQTPKKNIVKRFFAQVSANNEERRFSSGH